MLRDSGGNNNRGTSEFWRWKVALAVIPPCQCNLKSVLVRSAAHAPNFPRQFAVSGPLLSLRPSPPSLRAFRLVTLFFFSLDRRYRLFPSCRQLRVDVADLAQAT
jgi:hypothetical protein